MLVFICADIRQGPPGVQKNQSSEFTTAWHATLQLTLSLYQAISAETLHTMLEQTHWTDSFCTLYSVLQLFSYL